MTNYEKNKELLDVYAIAGVPWSVNKAGKIIDCAYSCYIDCIAKEIAVNLVTDVIDASNIKTKEMSR